MTENLTLSVSDDLVLEVATVTDGDTFSASREWGIMGLTLPLNLLYIIHK